MLAIEIITGNSSDIIAAVLADRVDFGFVTLPSVDRMLDVTPLLNDELVAIGPRSAERTGLPTPQQMATDPLLLYERGGRTRQIVDDWFTTAGVRPDTIMALGSVEAIISLVAAGLGRAIVPRMAVRASEGFEVQPLSPPAFRQLGLVIRQDKRVSRGLKVVLEAVSSLRERHAAGAGI